MSRYTRLLGSLLAVSFAVLPAGSIHAKDKSQGTIGTADAGPGFDNPPNADRNGRGYVNPCIGHEGFEAHVSRPTGLIMNDLDEVAIDIAGGGLTIDVQTVGPFLVGISIDFDKSFQVEYVGWRTACAPAEDSPSSEFEPGSEARYWIKRPTQGAVVPNLLAEVIAALPAPDISWPSADPEFGWIYVNTNSDVRVNPVATVRRSLTVSNLVGSVTAWVEASPGAVVFDPGEPGKGDISCTYEAATAPYVQKRATGCMYKYTNSSAISTEADSAFVARTSLSWNITSSGPLTYNNPLSWRQELIQVAEVQALVID